MSETNRIEYKQELNTNVDIEKEVIAFLNYSEGGLIYIGIDKLGKVLGVSNVDSDMLKIKDRIKKQHFSFRNGTVRCSYRRQRG